jgi:hypothetical protein
MLMPVQDAHEIPLLQETEDVVDCECISGFFLSIKIAEA